MATTLFSWRVPDEPELVNSDEPPAADTPVVELILNRCQERLEKRQRHLPHPEHAAYLKAGHLPSTLQVLRMDKCRIRVFPTLPAGIHELYAASNDFFTLPDLSGFEQLIVLELADNRIETLTNPWPPGLARLSLDDNILNVVTSPAPPDGCNITIKNCTGIEAVVNKHRQAYMRAVALAQVDNLPFPALPQIPLVPWIAARAPRIAERRREVAPRDIVRRGPAVGGDIPAAIAEAGIAGGPAGAVIAAGAFAAVGAVLAAADAVLAGGAEQRNPYTEAQNVHDSGIQASTRANLQYIASYRRELPVMDSATLLSQISRVLGEAAEIGGILGWITGVVRRVIGGPQPPPLPGPPARAPAGNPPARAPAGNPPARAPAGNPPAHRPPAPAGNPPPPAPAGPPPLSAISVSRRNRSLVLEELRGRIESQYSMLGFSPVRIVERLWVRIMDFEGEQRETAIRRFVEETLEARGFCMNGFMTRMANVLVGLDEHIKMEMNPTQILQGRVPATLTRLRKERGLREGAEPWFFWRDAILQTWEDIYEVRLPPTEVSPWLEPLFDPIVDRLIETRTWNRKQRDSWNDGARDVLARAGLCRGSAMTQTLESYLIPLLLERVAMLPFREEEPEPEPEPDDESASLLAGDKLKTE
jgi:hypothetical protein